MRYHPRRKHAFSVPTQAVKKTELPINPLD
jgi:hypothetical protein